MIQGSERGTTETIYSHVCGKQGGSGHSALLTMSKSVVRSESTRRSGRIWQQQKWNLWSVSHPTQMLDEAGDFGLCPRLCIHHQGNVHSNRRANVPLFDETDWKTNDRGPEHCQDSQGHQTSVVVSPTPHIDCPRYQDYENQHDRK